MFTLTSVHLKQLYLITFSINAQNYIIRNSIFALSEIYIHVKVKAKRNDGIVGRLFVNAFLPTSILPDKFPRFPRSYLNPRRAHCGRLLVHFQWITFYERSDKFVVDDCWGDLTNAIASSMKAAQDGGRSLSRGWSNHPCWNGTDTASFSFSWKSFYTGVSIRKYSLLIDVTKSFVEDVERLGAELREGLLGEDKVSVILSIIFKRFLFGWMGNTLRNLYSFLGKKKKKYMYSPFRDETRNLLIFPIPSNFQIKSINNSNDKTSEEYIFKPRRRQRSRLVKIDLNVKALSRTESRRNLTT